MLHVVNSPNAGITPGVSLEQNSLALRLRNTRLEKGWSQDYLARNANTSQAVIQKIENGKSLRPRNIECIAAALNVRPAWLMFGVREVGHMDEDAIQVARAWSKLKDPERSAMRETINRLSKNKVIGF